MATQSSAKKKTAEPPAEEMSSKLVRVQYDFLTNVVHGAGEALRRTA